MKSRPLLIGLALMAIASLAVAQPTPRMKLSVFAGEGTNPITPEAARRLAALRKGVEVMKARDPSDPTSWFFQAAVHGVTDAAIEEAAERDPGVRNLDRARFWNQCPHSSASNSADFLLWHRAYVYYFERILRAASGDPTLSLPYWNYTGGDRAFPPSFAAMNPDLNGLSQNPLWARNRDVSFVNGITQLADRVVSLREIEGETNFFGSSEDTGLAGGVFDQDASTQGIIERRPHNWLHLAIGGVIGGTLDHETAGSLADVPTAAFDPAFWVHHSNIDRIWSKWDALPNRSWGPLPERAWFVDRPWFFYDADKSVKNEMRAHYIRASGLGIRYDDDSAGPRLSDTLPYAIDPETADFAAILKAETGSSLVLSAGDSSVFKLNRAAGLQRPPPVARTPILPRTTLKLTFEPPTTVPNIGYDVVLMVTQADGRQETYNLGSLALFGLNHSGHHQGHPNGPNRPRTITQSFDLSKVDATTITTGAVSVRIEPFALFERTGKAEGPMPATRSGNLKVVDLSVVRQ